MVPIRDIPPDACRKYKQHLQAVLWECASISYGLPLLADRPYGGYRLDMPRQHWSKCVDRPCDAGSRDRRSNFLRVCHNTGRYNYRGERLRGGLVSHVGAVDEPAPPAE